MSTEESYLQFAHTYYALLNEQQFIADELNYQLLEQHIPVLQNLSTLSNSGVSVFDLYKKEHAFYSPGFCSLLGYETNWIYEKPQSYWDSRIHPHDHLQLMQQGVTLLKLFFSLGKEEKTNYKLINEYRMLNAHDEYIKVIEQHQVLELDKQGNLWLALSIIDISPNQQTQDEINSQLINFKTGEILPFALSNSSSEIPSIHLSQRENEILHLVKSGLLSKEISNKLNISLHTVNTHRQRILGKLGANNSMEAVSFASRLGLV